ncbi:uncharacterized protein [Antedon mediterranea]|uniref:uncharacterized protein isoform X1 n=1 Tax=Antedon mediterranea TaxID=105859 RepID=UPI003AF7D092
MWKAGFIRRICIHLTKEKMKITPTFGKVFRDSEYALDPDVTFCNNGAFSAVPKQVLFSQAKFRYMQETDPEAWFRYKVKEAISNATDNVADMFGSNKENLVLVENATTAANTILKSLSFSEGDKILITTHTFMCVKNAAMFIANNNPGVEVVVMAINLPILSKQQLVDSLLEMLNCHRGIKLAILDHITGPSGILFPIEDMIPLCHQRGVMVMVDGAHAPGQVELNLEEIGADFYFGNLHKWCYSARGCSILYVNPKHSDKVNPLVTSKVECPRLRNRFLMQGSKDYTALCSSSAAVEFLQDIGGLSAVKNYNEPMLKWATDMLCKAWNTTTIPIHDSLKAPFMILIKLPDFENIPLTPDGSKAIALSVYQKHKVHIAATRVNGRFWLRLSAHVYNTKDDYYKLRDALMDIYLPQLS